MTQARVVIRGAALEMGEHLLSVTRLATLTELINVMFSRYGKHLEVTWEVLPNEKTLKSSDKCHSPKDSADISQSNSDMNFKFDEPIAGL